MMRLLRRWHVPRTRFPVTVPMLIIVAVLLAFGSFPASAAPELDFGDAPAPYPTLLMDGGAYHVQSLPIWLGLSGPPDFDPDGMPDPLALGDDATGIDDEDGVQFATPIVPGQTMTVTVDSSNYTAGTMAFISAWIDFNRDGDWADPGEQILANVEAVPGPVKRTLDVSVPSDARPGPSYARFRISSTWDLTYEGMAVDGEVEDYLVEIVEPAFDWGDAPDSPYCTLASKNGACHVIDYTTFLGLSIDAEPDGQQSLGADGDDLDAVGDDEDGVAFLSPLIPGMSARVDVIVTFGSASYVGYLAIWADFNNNGSFSDPVDVFLPETVVGPGPLGTQTITFYAGVPASAVTGPTHVRVRFCDTPSVPCCGFYWYGEVEDYVVSVEEAGDLDWGDAPDPTYPTLNASNGACHVIASGMFLGGNIDPENDGQPNATATGDDIDLAGNDDDGVRFTSNMMPGLLTLLDVTASVPGCLDAWVDFNDDGDWDDANEQVFTSQPLSVGVNSLSFPVPSGATASESTFARFRYSSAGGLSYVGLAPDGEVEDYEVLIMEEQDLDWGDAPDPDYPTLNASDGACHVIIEGMYLGIRVDAENNGQPDANATGDDLAVSDDEDGVAFTSLLIPGSTATLDVTASLIGILDAWVDFNDDGDWDDAGERIFYGECLRDSVNHLTFTVPATAAAGQSTFARFRYSGGGCDSYTGMAYSGEVEDYIVLLQPNGEGFDFGDAPDPPYPTLFASNGAYHLIGSTYLGATVDSEPDGQQEASGFFYSVGDDWAGTDDEDGVIFLNEPLNGGLLQTEVTVAGAGYLDVWADFDRDGQWASAEHFIDSLAVVAGTHSVSFAVPPSASPGGTYVRFRISNQTTTECDGYGGTGEVEDYLIMVKEESNTDKDFGDAPDAPYPTYYSSSGAYHCDTYGHWIGSTLDWEKDGIPSTNADGDDLYGTIDDEDGISFDTPLARGLTATISCLLTPAEAQLDAWIDFNGDGDWADAGEQVFVSRHLTNGVNVLTFPVPANAVKGSTYARFRSSPAGNHRYLGYAQGGEVEDYVVEIVGLDWGDAPDPTYPTLAANNGACHAIIASMHLGTAIDNDNDGQPNDWATGDDSDAGGNDEDGVTFTSALVPGHQTTLDVTASMEGCLDAWLDFNDDGDWADTGEQVFASEPLTAGLNHLAFSVPGGAAVTDYTFARFRYSSAGGLSYTGVADDGEVEDYLVSAPQEVGITLFAGWNMVSVPLILPPDARAPADVFPDAEAVYTWDAYNDVYEQVGAGGTFTVIEPGRGYWVAVTEENAGTLSLWGMPVYELIDYPLLKGWNMFGSILYPLQVTSLDDTPADSIDAEHVYWWNPGTKQYDPVTQIDEGKGYWIAASVNCTVTTVLPS